MSLGVVVAVAMAVVAAMLFAVAAVAQNSAVGAVTAGASSPTPAVLGGADLRRLVRSRLWLTGTALTTVASIAHAGALILAPVVIVQPIGVLSVPLTVVLAARRSRTRPHPLVVLAVVVCFVAVAGFVTLADAQLGRSPAPRFADVVAAGVAAATAAGLLVLAARRASGWVRCVAFAAAAATAFGLVSALMRLVSLHLSTGVADLDDVGVWLPAGGIAAALLVGAWAVQQAHANGAPAVVVGCLTVIDPLVAVALSIAMLGEGGATSIGAVLGLIGFAALGLSAAVLLAHRIPAPGDLAVPAPRPARTLR